MKTRVLIVDDEKEFTQALVERLSMKDYDASGSVDSREAVEKITHTNYDVVVLDVRMPGMDGVEVLRKIKEIKPLTEVIMLTGHATVESAVEGMKMGAFDYLIKPSPFEELTAKIDAAYARKAEHEERIRAATVNEIVSSPRSVLKHKSGNPGSE